MELVGSELWTLSPDNRNDAIYKQHREQSLKEALSDSTESFSSLVSAIETLEDINLSDPKR
jgi:hypothetical protein